MFRLAHSEDAVEDIRRCIRFIEETTGARWSWDAYFAQMQRFNLETQFERQWRELNQTPYPQLIGPCAELFRRWSRALDCGAEARVVKTFEQVNRLVLEACERREEAWRGRMKYRAITWSCPAHYYADLSAWLANCWGVDVRAELESLDDARALETEDRETALNDLARRGDNNADELWRQCELWKAEDRKSVV